jgi:hypothetical protein
MLEDIKKKIVVFNIIISVIFMLIAINSNASDVYIHVFPLIGVLIFSFMIIILYRDKN